MRLFSAKKPVFYGESIETYVKRIYAASAVICNAYLSTAVIRYIFYSFAVMFKVGFVKKQLAVEKCEDHICMTLNRSAEQVIGREQQCFKVFF